MITVTVINTTTFFFHKGFWSLNNVVSGCNTTHVSLKSCRINPIRWRLRDSLSVCILCMRQTFSQRFEAETSRRGPNRTKPYTFSKHTHSPSICKTIHCKHVCSCKHFYRKHSIACNLWNKNRVKKFCRESVHLATRVILAIHERTCIVLLQLGKAGVSL